MGSDPFRELFEREAPFVLGRLRWLGVPDRDREDVAQNVFVDVARHLGELDRDRPARPWLATITCRRARDYFKRSSVAHERLDALDVDAVAAREDRMVERHAAADLVRRLVGALQYDHREVLVLVAIEERSVPEVAELLALPVKTVESRLARARERLTEGLQRLRAAEQRRLGSAATLPAILFDPDELLRAGRDVTHDDVAEVDRLRARVQRALQTPPTPPAATTLGTWAGLTFMAVLGAAGAIHAATRPRAPVVICAPSAEASERQVVNVATAALSPAAASALRPAPSTSSATSAAPTAKPQPSEAELLSLARVALRSGDRRRALVALRNHERLYPRGEYSAERTALLAQLEGSR